MTNKPTVDEVPTPPLVIKNTPQEVNLWLRPHFIVMFAGIVGLTISLVCVTIALVITIEGRNEFQAASECRSRAATPVDVAIGESLADLGNAISHTQEALGHLPNYLDGTDEGAFQAALDKFTADGKALQESSDLLNEAAKAREDAALAC